MSFMLDEIHEQPNRVERAIETERKSVAALAQAMKDRDIRFVVIAARGTSDHAATYMILNGEIQDAKTIAALLVSLRLF